MEKHLKKLPMALFCLYSLKHLIISASLYDIPGILMLGTLTGLFHVVSTKKEKDEFKEQIDKLQEEINRTKKIQDEILSGVAQLKISQGFKSVNSGR